MTATPTAATQRGPGRRACHRRTRPDTPPARSPDAPSGGVVGIPGDRCRVRLRVMGLPGAVRATVDAVEADTEPAATPPYLLDRHAPTGVLKSVVALRTWASVGYGETTIVVTHGDAPEAAEERSRPPDVRDGRDDRRGHARARAAAARPGAPRSVDRRAAPRRAEGPPPSETARGVAGPVAPHVSGLRPAGNRASGRRVLRLELSGPGAPAGPQAGVATPRPSPPTSGTTARRSAVRDPKIGKALPILCPEANHRRAEATVAAHGGAQLQSTVIDRRTYAGPGFRAYARRQAPHPPGIEGRR